MPAPRAADVLGRVTLVTGKEEFLNERTVVSVREPVRAHDPEAELSETDAADLSPGDAWARWRRPRSSRASAAWSCATWRTCPRSPSTGCSTTPPSPPTTSRWCSCTAAARRAAACSTKLRKLAAVHRVEVGRAQGLRVSRASSPPRCAATAPRSTARRPALLVQAVGQDLRSLAAAAHQLTNDFPGEPLTVEKVKQYFGGRAEAKSFAVADAAFAGRREVALEELRWALDGGTAAGAGHLGVRRQRPGLARYKGAVRGMREADLAREVGVPPWKLRTIRDQSARGPTPRSPARSGPWPRPTPTSRARPATRRTRWSGWCSPSPASATRAELGNAR